MRKRLEKLTVIVFEFNRTAGYFRDILDHFYPPIMEVNIQNSKPLSFHNFILGDI